jgi:FkbM family methyltransferase
MSSSAYRSTDLLREKFIGLQESDAPIELVAQRLDTLIANLNLEINDPSALVIDAQGSELSVLKGAGSVLRLFKYLEVEVSTEPIYEGAPLYQEVDKFLSDNSFSRISEVPWHGDVVYTRIDKPQPIILSQGDLENIQRIVSEREHYLTMIEEYKEFIKLNGFSKSQIGQDLFALSQNGFKRNGYFVEIGAASGVNLSNTYLLEKQFDWTGILVEPAPVWHEELHRERNSIIDKRCVWSQSGQILNFVSADTPELSTIATFIESDFHKDNRQGTTLMVASVSLIDLLAEYDAPREIEFLSIDTEGSELSILESFDFDTYKIKCIAVEHNWTAAREKIFNLLTQKGYRRVHHRVSQWDDWYVLS